MTVPQRVCSECSDDNGNVHSVIWLLSAEYCQCQQRSGAPATEHDRRQPWNHPESGASLQTYQGFSEENLDTKITRVQLCFLRTIPPIHCLTSGAVVVWSLAQLQLRNHSSEAGHCTAGGGPGPAIWRLVAGFYQDIIAFTRIECSDPNLSSLR